jgi:hypothetical protein
MGLAKIRVGKALAAGCFALGGTFWVALGASSPVFAQETTTTTTLPATTTTTNGGTGALTYPITKVGGATTTTLPAPTTTTTLKPAIAFTSAPPVSHGLAFTGADVAITMGAGAAALGAGGLIVLASRRRRQEP